jgi:hypothetical protein
MNLIQYYHWKHDKMQELRAERKKSHTSTARASSLEIAKVASSSCASVGEEGGGLDEEAELHATVEVQANLELMTVACKLL